MRLFFRLNEHPKDAQHNAGHNPHLRPSDISRKEIIDITLRRVRGSGVLVGNSTTQQFPARQSAYRAWRVSYI